jgi:ribosomal protein S18 acetylase RimI-like enzyme
MLQIFQAETDKDIELVRGLLGEYLAWMESKKWISSEESQAFEEQLANLPNSFAPPDGCLMLAMYRGEVAGCVALRKLNDTVCEMKRLYVKSSLRGLEVGRKLAEAVITKAQKIGYARMRVHTLQMMKAANTLYRSMGFGEIDPYEENVIEGGVFMELKLV